MYYKWGLSGWEDFPILKRITRTGRQDAKCYLIDRNSKISDNVADEIS